MNEATVQSLSDATLVKQSIHGDLQAFETLVARYQRSVFNVAYYKSRNCFDAEDLAQDIFMAAFKALSTLKDPDNFAGWLFGIAYNRCHKWFQRERNKIVKFQEVCRRVQQEQRLGRKRESPWNEDEPVLSELMLGLPDDVREALTRKYLEGQSYDEIGREMGIKFHRIDYLIRKGKKLIRQKWNGDDKDVGDSLL